MKSKQKNIANLRKDDGAMGDTQSAESLKHMQTGLEVWDTKSLWGRLRCVNIY